MHVVRKRVVDRESEAARVDGRPKSQVGNLVQRVHAGVGAPRAAQLDDVAAGFHDGPPELAGDRAGVLLLLPAAIAGPFVFEIEAVGRHRHFAAFKPQS